MTFAVLAPALSPASSSVAPSLPPLVDGGSTSLGLSTSTPLLSAVDCSLPPEERFGHHDDWQLELLFDGQPTHVESLQLQSAIAEIAEISCDADVRLLWLSHTHLEMELYGLSPGRAPTYLQATVRSERLEAEFHRQHISSHKPFAVHGTNASIISFKWERGLLHEFVSRARIELEACQTCAFHSSDATDSRADSTVLTLQALSLAAPADYPFEFISCWIAPPLMTIAAVVIASLMQSEPHFAGIINAVAAAPGIVLGSRAKRLGVAIQVAIVAW